MSANQNTPLHPILENDEPASYRNSLNSLTAEDDNHHASRAEQDEDAQNLWAPRANQPVGETNASWFKSCLHNSKKVANSSSMRMAKRSAWFFSLTYMFCLATITLSMLLILAGLQADRMQSLYVIAVNMSDFEVPISNNQGLDPRAIAASLSSVRARAEQLGVSTAQPVLTNRDDTTQRTLQALSRLIQRDSEAFGVSGSLESLSQISHEPEGTFHSSIDYLKRTEGPFRGFSTSTQRSAETLSALQGAVPLTLRDLASLDTLTAASTLVQQGHESLHTLKPASTPIKRNVGFPTLQPDPVMISRDEELLRPLQTASTLNVRDQQSLASLTSMPTLLSRDYETPVRTSSTPSYRDSEPLGSLYASRDSIERAQGTIGTSQAGSTPVQDASKNRQHTVTPASTIQDRSIITNRPTSISLDFPRKHFRNASSTYPSTRKNIEEALASAKEGIPSDTSAGPAANIKPADSSDALAGPAANVKPADSSDALEGSAASVKPATPSDTSAGTASVKGAITPGAAVVETNTSSDSDSIQSGNKDIMGNYNWYTWHLLNSCKDHYSRNDSDFRLSKPNCATPSLTRELLVDKLRQDTKNREPLFKAAAFKTVGGMINLVLNWQFYCLVGTTGTALLALVFFTSYLFLDKSMKASPKTEDQHLRLTNSDPEKAAVQRSFEDHWNGKDADDDNVSGSLNRRGIDPETSDVNRLSVPTASQRPRSGDFHRNSLENVDLSRDTPNQIHPIASTNDAQTSNYDNIMSQKPSSTISPAPKAKKGTERQTRKRLRKLTFWSVVISFLLSSLAFCGYFIIMMVLRTSGNASLRALGVKVQWGLPFCAISAIIWMLMLWAFLICWAVFSALEKTERADLQSGMTHMGMGRPPGGPARLNGGNGLDGGFGGTMGTNGMDGPGQAMAAPATTDHAQLQHRNPPPQTASLNGFPSPPDSRPQHNSPPPLPPMPPDHSRPYLPHPTPTSNSNINSTIPPYPTPNNISKETQRLPFVNSPSIYPATPATPATPAIYHPSPYRPYITAPIASLQSQTINSAPCPSEPQNESTYPHSAPYASSSDSQPEAANPPDPRKQFSFDFMLNAPDLPLVKPGVKSTRSGRGERGRGGGRGRGRGERGRGGGRGRGR